MFENFLEKAIDKMFEIAGYDLSYSDIKNLEDNWYQTHTMTTNQYYQWKYWCLKNKPKTFYERDFEMLNLKIGLRIKDA